MVIITSVEQNSHAERAGIRGGDVLVAINGNEINDVLDYRFYLAERSISLSLHRDGEPFEAHVIKGEYADIGMYIFGPMEAPIYKVNNVYRMRIIIKCQVTKRVRELVAALLSEHPKSSPKAAVSVDINPGSL